MALPPSKAAAAAASAMEADDGAADRGNNCLEIRTVQAVAFKVLVEALKELLTDTVFEFDASGLKVLAVDMSHTVLVHLKLEAERFEVYHCDPGHGPASAGPAGAIRIGVNMLNLHRILRVISAKDLLTLFIDREDVNHLCVRIENTEKRARTTYKLNLLDLTDPRPVVDSSDFSEVVTLPSADFQKICRDMHNLADNMEIKRLRDQLVFSCLGDFCRQETIISDGAGRTLPPLAGPEDIVQGVFSIKHLVLFTKCTNLCPTVELYLKNDHPIIVKYGVSSLGAMTKKVTPLPLVPSLSHTPPLGPLPHPHPTTWATPSPPFMLFQDEDELQAAGFLFQKPTPNNVLANCGAARDWPDARGIFHNKEKTFLVWVNEEDHMRCIAMENGGNVKNVFARFARAINTVEKSLNKAGFGYAHSEHLGYVPACPSNPNGPLPQQATPLPLDLSLTRTRSCRKPQPPGRQQSALSQTCR